MSNRIKGLYTGHPGIILAAFLMLDPSIERILTTTHMVPGRVGLHQSALLVLLARQYNIPGARFCNIGTLQGYSAALLAAGAPNAQVVALEPDPKRAQISRKNLNGLSNAEVLQVKSWDYPGTDWTLVFVDGAHRECARDLIYYERLVPGGLILFHDYSNHKFPEVRNAVNSLLVRLGKAEPDIEVRADERGGLAGVYKDS